MLYNVSKELLLARLGYLDEIKESKGIDEIDKMVSQKVKDLVESGEINTYMALESVYDYLDEKLRENIENSDLYVKEIISFIN